MGTPKLYKKAEQLGITKHPETVLYLSPTKVRETFSKITNNIVRTAKALFTEKDPNTETKVSGMKSSDATFLAPNWPAFIWIITKVKAMARWSVYKSHNSLIKIRLWAPPDVTRTIVQAIIDSQQGDPLRHVRWEKMTKQFGISESDARAAWAPFLEGGPLPTTQPAPVQPAPVQPAPVQPAPVQPAPVQPPSPTPGEAVFCPFCGKRLVPGSNFCSYCGQATN
jgi:hypothetical protein